ncbi:MAG: SDR family oxidoreductase [Gammaproteobacteria bacterium]
MALITGGAVRVGAAIARALHAVGYDVAIHYNRSGGPARELAAALNATRPDSAFVLRQELKTSRAPARIRDTFTAKRQRLDLLVNNASLFEQNPADGATVDDWERLQAVNLRAPYFLAVEFAPLLAAARGAVINIVDALAERPRAGYALYGISKAALAAATRALALDLAPEIRVNGVAPGAILWADDESPQARRAWLAATPLGRRGEPADIAAAVCYLARAPYVTGQIISVDGGRTL